MRVITGTARGRKLKALEGMDVRPTTDMVKEAVFSIVQFDVAGSNVLDLFAGSGQLGIEALSRGASNCVFVDANRESIKVIEDNVKSVEFNEQSKILNLDAINYLKTCKMTFDIAFLDPPYENGLIEAALPMLCEHLSDRGVIICEHEKKLVLPDNFGKMIKFKTYKYGRVEVTVYKHENYNNE